LQHVCHLVELVEFIVEVLTGLSTLQAGDLISAAQMVHPVESVPSVGPGQVTAFGPGLSHGIAGQPCNFTIVTKDAGAGQQITLIVIFSAELTRMKLFYHYKISLSYDIICRVMLPFAKLLWPLFLLHGLFFENNSSFCQVPQRNISAH